VRAAIPAPRWIARAACGGMATANHDLFYSSSDRAERKALETCQRCPVQAECLRFAVDQGEWYGIWGGKTQEQLRRLVISARGGHSRANWSSHPNALKTHCKHGHPLTLANTHYAASGERRCRTCLRAATADWARRHPRRGGERDA
jgi:WhiB family transcriptional regulator, redox-sensing transcriptional regulator